MRTPVNVVEVVRDETIMASLRYSYRIRRTGVPRSAWHPYGVYTTPACIKTSSVLAYAPAVDALLPAACINEKL